jgi:hypothetical protein
MEALLFRTAWQLLSSPCIAPPRHSDHCSSALVLRGARPEGPAGRPYNDEVRKVLLGIVGLYLSAALLTRVAEAKGVPRFQCGCEPDCWCKRPGVSLFRWVTPQRKHRLSMRPEDKARHAEDSEALA